MSAHRASFCDLGAGRRSWEDAANALRSLIMTVSSPSAVRSREESLLESRFQWFVAGLILLAATLRVPRLGTDGLWLDEAIAAQLATLPLDDFIRGLLIDTHPPLHFVLIKLVCAVIGVEAWTEAAVRSLSLVLGLASVWLIAIVGRRLVCPASGVLAAYLLAISPIHVHYSREGRGYTLLVLLILAAILVVSRVRERPTVRRAVACGVVLALLAYTHNIAHFVLLPLVLWLAGSPSRFRERAHRNAFLVTGFTALALYGPWLPATLGQAVQVSRTAAAGSGPIEWLAPVWKAIFPWQIPLSVTALSHGAPAPVRNLVDEATPISMVTGALSCGLIVAGVRARSMWSEPKGRYALLALFLLPLVLLFAASVVGTPIYSTGRVDVLALPGFVLLLAAGVNSLAPRASAQTGEGSASSHARQLRPFLVASLLVGLALAAVGGISQEIFDASGSDYRDRALVVLRPARDGDVLVITGKERSVFAYYARRKGKHLHMLGFPRARDEHPNWLRWTEYGTGRLNREASQVADAAYALAARRGRIVWVQRRFRGERELYAELARRFDMLEQKGLAAGLYLALYPRAPQ